MAGADRRPRDALTSADALRAAAPDPPLDGLTPPQRSAVTHIGGPLLVVAGPGAGKTSVMVRRAAWLVLEHGVDPGSLLVTTFTNEAAEELFDRLHRFLKARTNDVHISTLHAFCQTVLEDHPGPGRLGFEEDAPDAVEEYRAVAGAYYGRYRELLREEGLLDFATLQSVPEGSCSTRSCTRTQGGETEPLRRRRAGRRRRHPGPNARFRRSRWRRGRRDGLPDYSRFEARSNGFCDGCQVEVRIVRESLRMNPVWKPEGPAGKGQ